MRFVVSVCLAIVLVFGALKSEAQDYSELLQEFDARALTRADKRFLQTALAFEGHYRGILDGAWGRLSQRALDDYAMKEFGTPAQDWRMAMLVFSFLTKHSGDAWNTKHFDGLGMSFLVPKNAFVPQGRSGSFYGWRHTNSSLSYSLAIEEWERTEGFHRYTLEWNAVPSEPYILRRPGFMVTSSTARDGSTLYTRSNQLKGVWSTVMLSASRALPI